MNQWFEVKSKCVRQQEDGTLKRVTETYIIDALSFSEAEARYNKKIGAEIPGEFNIVAIKIKSIADVFKYEDSEEWYEAKVKFVSIDTDSGKEKKVSNTMIVTASTVKEAYERIKGSLSDMTIGFTITDTKQTSIMEVLPYYPELEDKEVDRRPATAEELESASQEEK